MVRDTPAITEAAYREAAMQRIEGASHIALPPDGKVERTLGGAYVQAFIWVSAADALPVPAIEQKEAA